MTRLRSRLKALGKALPEHDGMCALVELCRVIWRLDKEAFRKIAGHSSCRLLIPQFRAGRRGTQIKAEVCARLIRRAPPGWLRRVGIDPNVADRNRHLHARRTVWESLRIFRPNW